MVQHPRNFRSNAWRCAIGSTDGLATSVVWSGMCCWFFCCLEVLKRWSTPGNKRYLYIKALFDHLRSFWCTRKTRPLQHRERTWSPNCRAWRIFFGWFDQEFHALSAISERDLFATHMGKVQLCSRWGIDGPTTKKSFWPIASWICGTRSLPQSAHPSPLRINAKFYSKT